MAEESKENGNKSAFTVKQRRIILIACMVICAALTIGGFFAPPMGAIDGSVLTAVGELGGFCSFMCGLETSWGRK